MVIKFIYGMSGCAKTTTAMKIVKDIPLNNWTCIAFTHSAVNNLKDIFIRESKINEGINNNFMTIHKFLQIPISPTGDYTIIRRKKLKYLTKLVIVDEFSLIPLDIADYLFELSSTAADFIFVGDFIQLMPISLNREGISLSLLKSDFSNIQLKFNEAIRIADHLSNSLYSSEYFRKAQKMILSHNYRNGDKVHQVLNDALDYKFDNNIISLSQIKKYVDNGYVVLSGKYEYLAQAYLYYDPYLPNQSDSEFKTTKIGKIKMNIGDKMVLLENLDDEFVNGDEVFIKNVNLNNQNEVEIVKIMNQNDINVNESKLNDVNVNELKLDDIKINDVSVNELKINDVNVSELKLNDVNVNELKINQQQNNINININQQQNTRIVNTSKLLPYNFITCHKAQGRTIPKVLLILDDLFEITMLYTAITRARDDVKFIKFKHLPNKDDINAFKIMRDIIYHIPVKKQENEISH